MLQESAIVMGGALLEMQVPAAGANAGQEKSSGS